MHLAINLSHHVMNTTTTTRLARSHRLVTAVSTTLAPPKSTQRAIRIGKQWREYQGLHNWEGLLDPLDDALRSEILRYGKFVEAAYTAFDFDPASPTYATSLHSKHSLLANSGFPDSGYRVTRHLHATSSVDLPAWVDRAPTTWLSKQSSWIGFVAVSTDETEIARLGRRDIVISYRGTATCLEWLENVRTGLTCLDHHGSPMVASGFWSLYTTRAREMASLREEVREEVRRLLSVYKDEPISVTVTGHSLGAALGVLTAYDVVREFGVLTTVVSFGGPRVGNERFGRELERGGGRVLRIVNTQDVITKVPGFVIEGGREGWLTKWLSETGWVYAEVGRELRLSSSDSPRKDVRAGNVATCHDLGVYLHLVNSFMSSRCPIRATAEQTNLDFLNWFARYRQRTRTPVA
ncbi:hypothetical protein QJS10_CPA10g00986 [Acorus calamus]|uniref:Fungal lipase-type domain-containing protein n=1 Tax=Acorus calamus TaxID=4465 RepID=A0AAV9E263_ACOCL|nr:hypothetical protein QJS10_CPA10g00986 [Acorus calamus]